MASLCLVFVVCFGAAMLVWASRGRVSCGGIWHGRRGKVVPGLECLGPVRHGRHGMDVFGASSFGKTRRGSAWFGRQGLSSVGYFGRG